jgi:hypothetical protein
MFNRDAQEFPASVIAIVEKSGRQAPEPSAQTQAIMIHRTLAVEFR